MPENPEKKAKAWIEKLSKELNESLTDATLLDQDGQQLSNGRAVFWTQQRLVAFWPEGQEATETILGLAKQIKMKGEAFPILFGMVHSSGHYSFRI